MSSILKALKKLEQEKSLRREEEIDLPREILREANKKRTRLSWQWAGAVTAIILLICAVAILLNRSTTISTFAQRQEQTVSGPNVTPPANTARVLPVQTSPPPAAVVLREPETGSVPARRQESPPPQQSPSAAKPTPATVQIPTATAPVIQQTIEPAAKLPLPPSEAAELSLSVSGIAWNKDSADRLAIVNGQPLTTGSAISGAVVEEILPDRVRFSHNNRIFDVFLGKPAKSH